MGLYRLIYVSKAHEDVSYPDLVSIMEASERNNRSAGVTGLLCYGDDWFLQTLEGHRQAVSQTYNRIVGDRRHFNAELLSFQEIPCRQFVEWSMKAVQFGLRDDERQLILRYSSRDVFSPASMTAEQCFELMLSLAGMARVRVSTSQSS
ncbi:MAG: BLUF domain-containing protein [Oscillatoriales cyanobacterium SM2_2_1]|nr:BLUF domain-containing protein [Oscillatoriales cyanobacterium SM2_2_1]